jgi:phage terminase large subunit-like protein
VQLDTRKAREKHQFDKWSGFKPTRKQQEFFEAGAKFTRRMLRAGNQQGKSEAGAYETTCHAIGRYPPGWAGLRFDKPVRIWCCGVESRTVRDVQQKKLFGDPVDPESLGTGLIPREAIIRRTLQHGSSDSFDTVAVRHISGGVSTITFKTFEQGRSAHQGEPVDFIWDDEEVPTKKENDIFSEHLARTGVTKGSIIVTMTPLDGRTPLIQKFDPPSPGFALIKMTIWDLIDEPAFPHLNTREAIEAKIAEFAPHIRRARSLGEPVIEAGAVFSIDEERVKFHLDQLDPPVLNRLRKVWGIDPGIGHHFGAVLIGLDPEWSDTVYVLHAFRVQDQTPPAHVERMRSIGSAAPISWPRDAGSREHGSGEALIKLYENPPFGAPGMKICAEHAQWEDGSVSTEVGFTLMQQLAETGKLKIEARLVDLFDELRELRRDSAGKVVKIEDDQVSALRHALMGRSAARAVPLGISRYYGRPQWKDHYQPAGNDFDVFSGKPFEEDRLIAREWIGPAPAAGVQEMNWAPPPRRKVIP